VSILERLRDPLGRVTRPERLLPLTCALCALVLFASEFMTAFEFTPPGGEALGEQSNSDRHNYAIAVLAVLALIAIGISIGVGSKPAALAVAAAGAIALLIFLIGDLPDANAVGTFDDPRQSFFDAEAVPQAGFWLELVGALGLAVSGGALATLTPGQLEALRPRRFTPGPGPESAAGEAGSVFDQTTEPVDEVTARRSRGYQR
jgi:hypothetical protein